MDFIANNQKVGDDQQVLTRTDSQVRYYDRHRLMSDAECKQEVLDNQELMSYPAEVVSSEVLTSMDLNPLKNNRGSEYVCFLGFVSPVELYTLETGDDDVMKHFGIRVSIITHTNDENSPWQNQGF